MTRSNIDALDCIPVTLNAPYVNWGTKRQTDCTVFAFIDCKHVIYHAAYLRIAWGEAVAEQIQQGAVHMIHPVSICRQHLGLDIGCITVE